MNYIKMCWNVLHHVFTGVKLFPIKNHGAGTFLTIKSRGQYFFGHENPGVCTLLPIDFAIFLMEKTGVIPTSVPGPSTALGTAVR